MSKEMLEACILEYGNQERRHHRRSSIASPAYRRRYGQSDSVAIDFNERQVTLLSILFVKLLMKYLMFGNSLKDALAISLSQDKIKFEEAPAEFGRSSPICQTKPSWQCKQTRATNTILIKNMNKKIMSALVERLDNCFIGVNFAVSKPNCQNKTKSLEKSLLPTIVLKAMKRARKTNQDSLCLLSR